ncbi:capsular biosynthesis protein [Bacillus sp. MMSF_3328]|uniref:capsular biosynthesis protein n=1 Tax=Bacillus sp. MMSF_3328 TaxID=3047080 RepID=UPI00273F265B|nr:capsular biosynthesis protein [Bacillus sp. MMSF_3328]
MKKICILSSVNIKHMTLISIYTDKLISKGIPFDIIYMDKYGEEEKIEAQNIYRFVNIINSQDNKFKKILQYYKFVHFAKPILEKNKYDFVIVWNEITAMLFFNFLSKNWANKYCLNYRDYLYQDIPIISKINERVIKNAAFATISSDGYKKFLPNHEYIHVHSFNKGLLSGLEPRTNFQSKKDKLRITFIGNVRFIENNKRLLNIFKNDARFELHFYGTNAEVLKEYCKESGINNGKFYPAFPVNDTINFIKNTDIVNNLYGNNNTSLDYALSIKLYYGIYYRTPILVNANTYMAKKILEYNIGYVVDEINENLPDKIYQWYKSLDFDVFDNSCQQFISDISKNNQEFDKKIEEYLYEN